MIFFKILLVTSFYLHAHRDAAKAVKILIVKLGQSILLPCEYDRPNITLVTWSYFEDGKNEETFLYDMFHETTHPSFQSFCQPNRKSCNLLLLRAHKNNAGKYFCRVGNQLGRQKLAASSIELIIGDPNSKNLIVKTGHAITLPCKYDQPNITIVRWSYFPVGNKEETFLYDMYQETTHPDFKSFCKPNGKSCNLELLRADKKDAGKYICVIGKHSTGEKITVSVIELIVGELECRSNIDKLYFMLGENDCEEIKNDDLERTCILNFYGNLNEEIWFHWTRITGNGNLADETTIKGQYIKRNKDFTSIIISERLNIKSDLHESLFQCHLANVTYFDFCALPVLKVGHVKSVRQNTFEMQFENFHDITCSVNKSSNINCSYFWNYKKDDVHTKIEKQVLSSDHVKITGLFKCFVSCQLGKSRHCHFQAMEVNVLNTDGNVSAKEIGAITVGFISCILISFVSLVCLKRLTKKKQQKYWETILKIKLRSLDEDRHKKIINLFDELGIEAYEDLEKHKLQLEKSTQLKKDEIRKLLGVPDNLDTDDSKFQASNEDSETIPLQQPKKPISGNGTRAYWEKCLRKKIKSFDNVMFESLLNLFVEVGAQEYNDLKKFEKELKDCDILSLIELKKLLDSNYNVDNDSDNNNTETSLEDQSCHLMEREFQSSNNIHLNEKI